MLPRVVRAAFVEGRTDQLYPRPVAGTFLFTVYCVDEGESVRYLDPDTVVGWGMDVEALHALALENLRRRSPDAPQKVCVPK
jgi:hypothetical protein